MRILSLGPTPEPHWVPFTWRHSIHQPVSTQHRRAAGRWHCGTPVRTCRCGGGDLPALCRVTHRPGRRSVTTPGGPLTAPGPWTSPPSPVSSPASDGTGGGGVHAEVLTLAGELQSSAGLPSGSGQHTQQGCFPRTAAHRAPALRWETRGSVPHPPAPPAPPAPRTVNGQSCSFSLIPDRLAAPSSLPVLGRVLRACGPPVGSRCSRHLGDIS